MESKKPAVDNQILGNTKADLLKWMEAGNSTLEWDGLLAFDRATINRAFLQQYIERFSSSAMFPEVDQTANLTLGAYRIFDRCMLSEPRMSFAAARITDAEAAGKLSMDIHSGREMTLDYRVTDDPKVDSISQITAVDGPVLEVDLPFANLPDAGYVGVLGVDLSAGKGYTLSSGQSSFEAELTGTFFRDVFAKWPADKRRWVINKVPPNNGAVAIENFFIRVQAAPGATVRSAENYGDGAVVVFLQMKGSERGTYPAGENQLHYLIPNDAEQFTATTILTAKRFLRAITKNYFAISNSTVVAKPMVFVDGSSDLQLKASSGALRHWSGIETVQVGETDRRLEYWLEGDPVQNEDCYYVRTNGEFQVVVELRRDSDAGDDTGGNISLAIMYELENYRVTVGWREVTSGDLGPVYHNDLTLSQPISTEFKVAISGGGLLSTYSRTDYTWLDVDNVDFTDLGAVLNIGPSISLGRLYDLPNRIKNVLPQELTFDLSPLNNFLMTGDYATTLTSLAAPHDVALFGHVAQKHLTFSITPLLQLMAHSTQHTFKVNSTSTSIRWKVENIPGENFFAGAINAVTGVYTAPAAEQIEGLQVRIKVTAYEGGYSTSALVTVLKRPVNINPRVQFISAGASCDLSAGAMPGLAKTWTEVPAVLGKLTQSSLAKRDKRFTAPALKKGVTLDVVPITVTAGGKSESAYVCVRHDVSIIIVTAGTINVGRQTVQLQAEVIALPIEVTFTWRVVAGSGSISASGLLSADAEPSEPFVLVTATGEALGVELVGYICLPLPLAPFPLHEDLPVKSVPTYVLGDDQEEGDDADQSNAAG